MAILKGRLQGFTIVELTAVITVSVLLAVLAGISMASIVRRNRQAEAVALVQTALEHARVAAIESGTHVYVAFSDQNTSPGSPEDIFRSFIVFRDKLDTDVPQSPESRFVFLTGWKKLPAGVAFVASVDSVITAPSNLRFQSEDGAPGIRAFRPEDGKTAPVPCLVFNPSGGVDSPTTRKYLRLLISGPISEATEEPGQSDTLNETDVITVARLTGRTRHEYTPAAD